ncbi:MAG: hypothetical protein KC563_11820, partial [Nitrospira sp.]|nr:hypothetical protein [Nitrospira sp.]
PDSFYSVELPDTIFSGCDPTLTVSIHFCVSCFLRGQGVSPFFSRDGQLKGFSEEQNTLLGIIGR